MGEILIDTYELSATLCQKAMYAFEKKREPVAGSRSQEMWLTLQRFNRRLLNGNELTERQKKQLDCICETLGVS